MNPPRNPSPSTQPSLKPSKVKLRLKKTDIRQCRLCMRVLPKAETIDMALDSRLDQRRKILEAVGVRITVNCKLKSVCVNCWVIVDIVYNFRATCQQADTLHGTRLLMMHPGLWLSKENKQMLINCHKLVEKNRAEMTGLFKCSTLDKGDEVKLNVEQEPLPIETVILGEIKKEEPPEEQPPPTEPAAAAATDQTSSDSDPEQTEPEQCAQKLNEPLEYQPSSKKSYNAKDHMCELCGKMMRNVYAEWHHNSVHLRTNPYECSEQGCNRKFPSLLYVKTHVRKDHLNKAAKNEYFDCPTCSKQIKGKFAFRSHLKTHEAHEMHPEKQACTVCGKYFYKRYMKDHMFVHTGQLPYRCEFCDRKYAAWTNWWQHRKKHHADQLQRVQDSGGKS
ncbi:zinc finger protein 574 [Aedes albopictus]|uniref:C2H2-type domain-containing protein n=1 Tax=Aedes albopictus TaxID=7160 RepID=A0ABM1YSY3_AEDAL|nr:zinc finger protein 574-like [Aedes albopictus]